MIKVIAATSLNRIIGRKGALPWQIPYDWAYFLTCTRDDVLIVGRKSYDEFGRALFDRQTIVLSKTKQRLPDAIVCSTLEDAIERGKDIVRRKGTIWIGGGEDVYEQGFKYADELYLTRIHRLIDGDTYLPKWEQYFTHLHSTKTVSLGNLGLSLEVWKKTRLL